LIEKIFKISSSPKPKNIKKIPSIKDNIKKRLFERCKQIKNNKSEYEKLWGNLFKYENSDTYEINAQTCFCPFCIKVFKRNLSLGHDHGMDPQAENVRQLIRKINEKNSSNMMIKLIESPKSN
jgi:hypothetical protein